MASRTGAPEPEGTIVFPPDWVMLDRDGRTICHADRAAAREAVKNDRTAVKVRTSSGHSGYFSFALADPPKVSYLDLHWKSVSPAYPSVLAADENLVLLHVAIPTLPTYYDAPAGDLFVYEAGPSPSSLRLPAYTRPARGVAGRSKFLEDDLVADLIAPAARDAGDPMIAKLCVYSSKKGKWKVFTMTGQSHNRQLPSLWSTDNVLPFDGRFLCWVDYFSGVLLCDFSMRSSGPMLHFVPFPGKHYSDKAHVSKCYPDRFRSVSISQGMMRFVHIDNDWHETVGMDDDWDEEVHDDWDIERAQAQPRQKSGSTSPFGP